MKGVLWSIGTGGTYKSSKGHLKTGVVQGVALLDFFLYLRYS